MFEVINKFFNKPVKTEKVTYGGQFKSGLTFDEVRNTLGGLSNINNGGCGIAALVMYNFLKERGLNSHIVFFNVKGHSDWVIDNINYDSGNVIKAKPSNHIGIYHNNKFIDAVGDIKITKYSYIELADEDKLISALNNNGWNSDFKREKAFEIIEKKLGISLQHIRID